MTDCIFCRIVRGEIPSDKVYEDDEILGFSDIQPVAPVHCLFVPKAHLATLNDADPSHQALLGRMLLVAARVAKAKGVAETGYRVLINVNRHGGQVVFHVHLHLLGGRPLEKMG